MAGRRKAAGVAPVRRVPRTTSARVASSCGHEWVSRFPVPAALSPGAPWMPDTGARLESVRAGHRESLAMHPCADCVAVGTLADVRRRAARLTVLVDAAPLPELPGSVRLQAFAEGKRLQCLEREVANVMWTVVNAVESPMVFDSLAAMAMAEAWPSAPVARPSGVRMQGAYALQEGFRSLAMGAGGFLPGRVSSRWADGERLALWVVLRFAWRAVLEPLFSSEIRPRFWIARGRRAGGPSLVDLDASLAAVPVARLVPVAVHACRAGAWRDQEAAYAAVMGLARLDVSGAAGYAASRRGVSLPEVAEELLVLSALAPEGDALAMPR